MTEREIRHKLASLQSALNLARHVLANPNLSAEKRAMAADRVRRIEEEMRVLETELPAGGETHS